MSIRSIVIPHDKLAAFCQRHHIRRLSLFGSILWEDFREDSDVDVLVEFEEELLAMVMAKNCLIAKLVIS
jgi:predicted nucleotidyltransferase